MKTSKPRSEKQRAASRANGARSRGPVTLQGKANAHLARAVLLENEDPEYFNALVADLNSALRPETEIDHLFIAKMAAAHWRQIRVWKREKEGDPDEKDREMRYDRQFCRAYDCYLRGQAFSDTRTQQLIENKENCPKPNPGKPTETQTKPEKT